MREAFPRDEASGTSCFESSDTRSAVSGDGSDRCVDHKFFFRQPQQKCSVKQGVMFRLAWAMHDCVLLISVSPRPFENDPLPAIDESDTTYGEHIGHAYMRSFSNLSVIDDT